MLEARAFRPWIVMLLVTTVGACGDNGGTGSADLSMSSPPDLAMMAPGSPFAIGDRIDGKTYAEWGVEWQKAMMALPRMDHPFFDVNGMSCTKGQPASGVWYLVGTAYGVAAVTRSCTVPAGRKIFFPVVNYLNDFPCPDPNFKPASGQTLEDFLVQGAKAEVDKVSAVTVEIDGTQVANVRGYRAASRLFRFTADATNVDFDACVTGMEQDGATDGYWMMLSPFAAGQHRIHFTAVADFGMGSMTVVDTTYDLMVQ